MVGPATQEMEVVAMEALLESGKVFDLNDRANLKAAIENRKAVLLCGLRHPTAVEWTKRLQAEVEPLLRMRLCPIQGFVIDRWVAEYGCWHQVPGTCGFDAPRPGLCERMRTQYDMWKRATPKENEDAVAGRAQHPIYREHDAASQKVRDENERKASDAVLGAVDKLSDKRIKEFIAVERAVQTGETITAHGETERSLDRMRQASFRAEQESDLHDESQAMNPQDHPLRQTRATGGKHVRE